MSLRTTTIVVHPYVRAEAPEVAPTGAFAVLVELSWLLGHGTAMAVPSTLVVELSWLVLPVGRGAAAVVAGALGCPA